MSSEQQLNLNIGGATHVRLTGPEYTRLQNDSFKLSKSIPTLLKESYFNRLPTKVLVNQKDLDILRNDMNKIGNNLNQIARKINSGLMKGWSNALDKVYDEFNILTKQIHYGYGIRKG